eukprot:7937428-Pyramimonas_sp.AAC.1
MGVPKCARSRMRSLPMGYSVELPNGCETCEGCAEIGEVTHVIPTTGASGGAPCMATKRAR